MYSTMFFMLNNDSNTNAGLGILIKGLLSPEQF